MTNQSNQQRVRYLWMRTAICWICAVLLTADISAGQQASNRPAKVLTVCEVLGDFARYTDTAVVVVGRRERSVSNVDQYEFLSQDRCPHSVITHGHVWLDKLNIWTAQEAGPPRAPRDTPVLEESALAAKLLVVRQTTKLGFHQEPRYKAEGRSIMYSHTVAVPNEWAAVYGRIVKVPDLNTDCGAGGCGGFDVPLVIVAAKTNVYRLTPDGRRLSAHD